MTLNPTNKRKALRPLKSMVKRHIEVNPLRIEDMVIDVLGRANCYFKRLKYIGCPRINTTKQEFDKGIELIDAGRDDFIRECYRLMNVRPTETTVGRFYSLVDYLKWVDDTGQEIPEDGYLAWSLIEVYMKWCKQQHKLGRINKANFTHRKRAIAWFLKQLNRSHEKDNLPKINGRRTAIGATVPLDLESELKPTVKALFRAYSMLLKHFNNSTLPDQHPLYDKDLVENEAVRLGLKGLELAGHRGAFKKVFSKAHPNKHLVEVAMMLTYMFTGINNTPLAKMRLSDVSFREVQGGKYIFDSEKGRAAHQEQDSALGFSKHAKQFIESWLEVSKKLANGDEISYLFPYFSSDGRTISYSQTSKQPQQTINKLLARMRLTPITPSKLRKTKSDTLFRVTESVYLVAMSNNNSMVTTARTYIHGTEKEHENNLSAAMSAKHAIVKGKETAAAVEEAKYDHGDILDDYEYQRLRKGEDRTHEARTPTGTRCNDSRKGAALIIDRSLKKAGIKTGESEVACTDFLSCFHCQQHVFITDVDDIWLMLSFKETLQQLQQTPAVNSMPERKYTDLFNTVVSVLKGFKDKNESNYSQALEKLKDAPHPLYSTVYSLNDLLEIFA